MLYTTHYESPLGDILLAGDAQGLVGLWLTGQKYFANCLGREHMEGDCSAFIGTREWLDIYFSGKEPSFLPPLHMMGTEFQRSVWKLLLEIPYGKTVTYGEIAKQIATRRGFSRMSAQAVGGAVGHNEISIIIPCHRVVGTGGNLTGYAGGIDKKIRLLTLEGADMSRFFTKDGTVSL